ELIRGPIMRVVLIILTLSLPVSAFAQPYLEPSQPNTYGPGVNSDDTGQPFVSQTESGDGPADPVATVRSDASAQPYLEPYQPNAYGPGINRDASGRPFVWQTEPGDGPADPLAAVRPDAYGPGIGVDQYGRPVSPASLPPSGQDQDDDD